MGAGARVLPGLLVIVVAAVDCLVGEARAQEEITLFDLSREVRYWGVDEGIPQERVEVLIQGPKGYLWLAGREYISRFDGQHFQNHEPLKHLGGNGAGVRHLAFDENEEGALWFASSDGRLAIVRNGHFIEVHAFEGPGTVADLLPRPGGGVIVSHGEPGERRLHSVTGLDGGVVNEIGPDGGTLRASKDGRIWSINGRESVLCELASGRWKPVGLDGTEVWAFVNRLDGTPAVLTEHGIFVYRSGEWSRERMASWSRSGLGSIRCVCQDLRGFLFILSEDQGVYVVRPDGRIHRLVGVRGARFPQNISGMLPTPDGSVWIHSPGGLYQWRYVPAVTLTPPKVLGSQYVYAVGEDATGLLWFSCDSAVCVNDGVLKLHHRHRSNRRWFTVGDELGARWMYIRNMNESPNSVRLERNGVEVIVPRPAQGTGLWNAVVGFEVDSKGVAWMAFNDVGVYRCDPSQEAAFSRVDVGSHSGNNAMAVAIDKNDHLFVSLSRQGVYRCDAETGEWTLISQPDDALAKWHSHLEVDHEGRVWGLSFPLGLIGYWSREESAQVKLSDLHIRTSLNGAMAFDNIGGVWLGTHSEGVAHIEHSELLAKLRDPGREVEVTRYDRRHGLATKHGPYNFQGMHCASDGRIWVATAKGASVFNPDLLRQEKRHSAPPPVHIERVTADGRELLLPRAQPTLRLPVGVDELRIRSVALDFGRPGEVTFRYRLRGLTEDWIDGGVDPVFLFQRLPPGDFRFEVFARNRFGAESAMPAVLAFAVPPQWWQRLSSKIAAVLLVVAILVILYRRRVATIRRRGEARAAFSKELLDSEEEVRKRIAGQLNARIGQLLHVIKNSVQLTRVRVSESSPARKRLEDVTEFAASALGEVQSIATNLCPVELDQFGLRVATESMIERVAESCQFEIKHDLVGLDADWFQADQIALYRLIQEGLNNVIKHAEASLVIVEARREGEMVHIMIDDDGKGFEVEKPKGKSSGLGMTNLRERAVLLGGRLTINSRIGRGTRLEFDIPLLAMSLGNDSSRRDSPAD